MAEQIKIVIVGIGGVGGYFGGLLASKYRSSNRIQVIFVARGQHLKKIREDGLKVIQGRSEFIARPKLAVENTDYIGIANYILICTKSYDLEDAVKSLASCINKDTILLPLLNGVDAPARIAKIYPNARVWLGCVYIISRLKNMGIIENSGNIQKLFFGLDNKSNRKLHEFDTLLQNAGIESNLTKNISTVIWEKYIFISAMATATSYFDASIGKVLLTNQKVIVELIKEVSQIARVKNIEIDQHIERKVLNKLRSLPFETTSSMHSDFQSKRPQTELDTLTGYVVQEGIKHKIGTPTYNKLYNFLQINSPKPRH